MSEPCTTLHYSDSFVRDGRSICERFFTPQHRQNTPSPPSAAPPRVAAIRMSKVKVAPAADPYASDDRKGWDSSLLHERGESGNKKMLPRPFSLLSRRGAKGTCDTNMAMFHLLCPGSCLCTCKGSAMLQETGEHQSGMEARESGTCPQQPAVSTKKGRQERSVWARLIRLLFMSFDAILALTGNHDLEIHMGKQKHQHTTNEST